MLGAFILHQLQTVTYSHHSNKTERHVNNYMYHETRICRQTFCFVITVTEKKLNTLKAHFKDKSAWEHQKAAKNTTCTTEIEAVNSFIGNYAIVTAINLPRTGTRYKSDNVPVLPTGHNEQYVYQQYCLVWCRKPV